MTFSVLWLCITVPWVCLQCAVEITLFPGDTRLVSYVTYRESYMSAHVLLNLLNELGKRDKMRGLPSILSLFRKELKNSIIQEHEC